MSHGYRPKDHYFKKAKDQGLRETKRRLSKPRAAGTAMTEEAC